MDDSSEVISALLCRQLSGDHCRWQKLENCLLMKSGLCTTSHRKQKSVYFCIMAEWLIMGCGWMAEEVHGSEGHREGIIKWERKLD
jgi:hypothetical protein